MDEFINEYVVLLRKTLSDERLEHSFNVAKMAEKLAEIHNDNCEKAYVAGLLHDIRKEIPRSELKREVIESDYNVEFVEIESPKLWHAIAGAHYAKKQLNINDSDILNAIRFHTIGRENMSKLEKIIYLADIVSEDRKYPEIEYYRNLSMENLDLAMYKAVCWSIKHVIDKGGKIPSSTLLAYNYYLEVTKND